MTTTAPGLVPTVSERLWAKIDIRGPDDCWPFMGARSAGYGNLRVGGRTLLAHRLVEAEARGALPPGCVVRHDCDNPSCCNPAHLMRGSQKDNMQDCVRRGRLNSRCESGEANGGSRFTAAQIMSMRTKVAAGATYGTIAQEFDTAESTVSAIVKGKLWKHLPLVARERVMGPGLCRCGCGERTARAKKTNTAKGHIAGQPVPYRRGHWARG